MKNYKIEPQHMYPFHWNGFLECMRYCKGTLVSIHLFSGQSIIIQEDLEFEGSFTLTRRCKDILNAKIKSTYPLILRELTTNLNKGYIVIQANLNQYDLARWHSYKFNITAY